MKRILPRLLFAASLALSASAAAQAPDRIVFATDWLAQAEHGGFYQAVAEGTYRKHGLDVTIRPGGTGRPRRVISARLAPLPPSRSRIPACPSLNR
jgi:NitT/TauT family transport system substrate-binding protein